MKTNLSGSLMLWLILSVGATAAAPSVVAQSQERISRFNAYSGYSQPVYDGWKRSSQYISVRDGTRLAVDILRPTKNGQVASERLPVIWTHHRYHRASVRDGQLRSIADSTPWLATVIKHGYIVAAVDTRGGGASYGTQQGFFSPEEANDAYDITEWLAVQPWSTGAIGMFGRSYLGITQYFAASKAPPHLKAIFPEMSVFEWYPFIYPGGIYRNNFFSNWNHLTKNLDSSITFDWYSRVKPGVVARVDEDSDGKMLAGAIQAHKENRDMVELFSPLRYRNSLDQLTGKMIHHERSPASYIDEIGKSGVAIYHLNGWFDMFPRDALLWFKNLRNPQKVVIGPWFHSQSAGLDMAVEHLRWYDYWLRGIKNGVMDEPPIHYWTMGAPDGQEWRASSQWPLPNERPTAFYFQSGPSGSIRSVNDGRMTTAGAAVVAGQDNYTVDYTTTSEQANRWANGYGGDIGYPDLTPNDEKGLTYTTAPLSSDIEVTGHPVVHLWITSTAKDGDFFVYLEEVAKDGKSNYVTEGALRASHRAISRPPYNYLGLPFHRSFAADLAELAGGPVELVFDLHPLSNIFDAGNRIRITITCADKDNTLTPRLVPRPKVSVYRNSRHPSRITLPVIPAASAGKQ